MTAQGILHRAAALDIDWQTEGRVSVAHIGGNQHSVWVRPRGDGSWRWDTATAWGVTDTEAEARAQAEAAVRLAVVLGCES